MRRGLTFRSFFVCIFALLLMGMWNEYHTCYLGAGGDALLENTPPNGAVTTLVIVLIIAAVLYRFRRPLGLVTAELVVIYAALLIAAPMMTQGLWHRLFGLIAALPHDQDFKSYESLPTMLWPHGDNLVINGRFVAGLKNFEAIPRNSTDYTLDFEKSVSWKGGRRNLPRLTNADKPDARSQLQFSISRFDARGREVIIPGESYLFSCLVKTTGFKSGSYYFVQMAVDKSPPRNVLLDASETPKTFANPSGLKRIGKCPVIISTELQNTLTFAIGLNGPGKLTVHDIQFFNAKGVEAAYTGVKMARERDLQPTVMGNDGQQHRNPDYLAPNERENLVIKPDNMLSLKGLGYLLRGFIPMEQWIVPMFAWSLLIGALFMGFFGVNVLLRKQWVESERFTYPMNLFPRQFFGEDAVDLGDMFHKLFTNRALWFGFAIMLPIVLLKGIHFYVPSVPAPNWSNIWGQQTLAVYFTNPLLKAFFGVAGINLVFSLLAITLLIETDLLFSLWCCFLLFQLWHVFGQAFNFTRFEGYPWQHQQTIGAFIAYALLALITARKHLAKVIRQIFGRAPRDDAGEVVSYRTAFIMIIASLITIGVWGVWTQMGLKASLLFFGWILVCGLTASKIRAEAGLPFGYWMPWLSMMFVSALGGFVTFGATGMLVAAIVSGFIGITCFYFVAPAQVEIMELGRHFKVRPRDVGWGLLLGLLGGLIIGGFTFMSWAYGKGADNFSYSWPYIQGTEYFNRSFVPGEAAIDSAFVGNKMTDPKTTTLDFIHNVDAKGMAIGFAITFIFAFLRQTFMWFPLHPLGYVVAGPWFGYCLWFTCFLAWVIRVVTLRIGGAHSIRRGLVPFSIGMFLACITSIIIFEIVGFYFQAHGMTQVYSGWP